MTQTLEDQAISIRSRISKLQTQLEDIEARLHKKRVRETGLVGLVATSNRVPTGVVIDDVTFLTWEPATPQSVSGLRPNSQTRTTIHVSSPGYQLHNPNAAGSEPKPPGVSC